MTAVDVDCYGTVRGGVLVKFVDGVAGSGVYGGRGSLLYRMREEGALPF
ncbi:hypothetical protein [Micromonospora sp. SH-82]